MGKASEAQQYPGDSEHPTPDLYDMVLMLSTEPGLDAWWSNVTEILVEAYGAERASLARPGDITDLENVPRGLFGCYFLLLLRHNLAHTFSHLFYSFRVLCHHSRYL